MANSQQLTANSPQPDMLDLLHVLIGAASGVVGAVLTYLATRRQHQVSERRVYLEAMENLTAALRSEIERVNADRRGLLQTIAALEARIADLEDRERALQRRVADLEAERDRLLERVRGG